MCVDLLLRMMSLGLHNDFGYLGKEMQRTINTTLIRRLIKTEKQVVQKVPLRIFMHEPEGSPLMPFSGESDLPSQLIHRSEFETELRSKNFLFLKGIFI